MSKLILIEGVRLLGNSHISETSGQNSILIVDDIASNRRILKSAFASYKVYEADTGEEALQIASSQKPDIILLDIQMPGIDGYEVCRRLKASKETVDIPVIFITGADGPGTAGLCFKVGAVDFVMKPFDLQEVRARVQTHLQLKQTSELLANQNRILEEQVKEHRLNLKLARQLLDLVDLPPDRYCELSDDMFLFFRILNRSCHQEGGDHYLIKNQRNPSGRTKTLISLKDQSGHSVNCILRSIITDLFHNSVLFTGAEMSLGQSVGMLNNAICGKHLFAGDDFFTAIFLELDHQSFSLEYLAAGHPPLFLVRQGRVNRIPKRGSKEINLPLGFQEGVEFSSGRISLKLGDRILLFTDGLLEMPMSCQSQPLSVQDFEEVVEGLVSSNSHLFLSEFLNAIPDAVMQKRSVSCTDLAENLYDDVTIIGLEVTKMDCHQWQQLIPHDFGGIDNLIEELILLVRLRMKEYHGLADEFSLRMAVTEGVLNAWKHGNEGSLFKPISFGWHVGNDLSIFLKDQGAGFDYQSLQNPVHFANRKHESGRGIFCMKKYADFVGWKDGGSTLILSFKREDHLWEVKKPTATCRTDLWQDPFPKL